MTTNTERYEMHAEFFSALSNPTRHAIFHELCHREATVSELAMRLNFSKPNVSQHLAILGSHELVRRRHSNGRVLWSVTDPRLVHTCDLVEEVLGSRLQRHLATVDRQVTPYALPERRPGRQS
jgi:DNA-binding transcriptional ArsR family regulator